MEGAGLRLRFPINASEIMRMKKTMQSLAIAAILMLVPLVSGAQGFDSATQALGQSERTALFPSRETLETGREVAGNACADCHGMDGISTVEGKPHLAGQRTVYTYRVLKAFAAGTRPDESSQHNKFLNDEALLSVAVYYASLMPAPPVTLAEEVQENEITVEEDEDPFQDLRPAMKKCLKCHNESGNSDSKGMPSLTAQHPEYFVTSMRGYIDGSRSHKLMKKLVGRLDEAAIQEMGVYYAVQQPEATAIEGEGDANVGRRLSEECESCHGVDGNAKKSKMPTLAGQDAKYFIKAMTHYKDGKRKHEKMFEAVDKLSEEEVIDLATFYAAQEPRRRDVRAPLKSTEWIARCERCHGIDGNSNDPRFPMLAGQDATYLKAALKAYAADVRGNRTMHVMADPLSPRDIERIGLYFASQQPKAVIYIQVPAEDSDAKTN